MIYNATLVEISANALCPPACLAAVFLAFSTVQLSLGMSAELVAESAASDSNEANLADKLEALSLSEQGARGTNNLEEDESGQDAMLGALCRVFLSVANESL